MLLYTKFLFPSLALGMIWWWSVMSSDAVLLYLPLFAHYIMHATIFLCITWSYYVAFLVWLLYCIPYTTMQGTDFGLTLLSLCCLIDGMSLTIGSSVCISFYDPNKEIFAEYTAVQSKNAVRANIKHNRYFHLTPNFRPIHCHGKRLYGHMFDMVDSIFSYWRALIVC